MDYKECLERIDFNENKIREVKKDLSLLKLQLGSALTEQDLLNDKQGYVYKLLTEEKTCDIQERIERARSKMY